MKKLRITLEVEVPDVDASYQDIDKFIWFYICQEGGIGNDNPLYEADYEITDCDFEYA